MKIIPSEFMTSYGKFAVWGASKQGKTYWALQLATILATGGKVGVISTENGNDRFLAPRFPHDTIILNKDEDGDPIPRPFSRQRTIEALDDFIKSGHKAIVLDSASAVWEGEGGFLDEAKSTNKEKGKTEKDFQVWDAITPLYRTFMSQLLDAPIHIVFTVRAKDKYGYEPGRNGKIEPTNKGEGPIQRAAFFYDLYGHFHIHEFATKVEGTYCDPLLQAFPDREIKADEQERAFIIMRDWLKGKDEESKAPMELELLRYKAQNMEWAQKTPQWKQRVVYMVLPQYKGLPFPGWNSFTEEDVAKMEAWVNEKLQPKQPTPIVKPTTASTPPEQMIAVESHVVTQPEPSVNALRTRVDEVKPVGRGNSVLDFESFYQFVTKKQFTSDDAISPTECQRIGRQLDGIVQSRINKQKAS
jgi:hypothetical protein